MKKLIPIVLSAALLLTACGGSSSKSDGDASQESSPADVTDTAGTTSEPEQTAAISGTTTAKTETETEAQTDPATSSQTGGSSLSAIVTEGTAATGSQFGTGKSSAATKSIPQTREPESTSSSKAKQDGVIELPIIPIS